MSFDRVKPGGWAEGERLTHVQANDLDVNVTRALDGHGGGEYDPSSALVIGGEGLRVGTPTVDAMPATKQYVDTATSTLTSTKVTAAVARFEIAETVSSPTTTPGLTTTFADSGYSIIGGVEVEVPAADDYLVSWCGDLVSTNNTTAVNVNLFLMVGGNLEASAPGRRSETADTVVTSVRNCVTVRITNPATQRIGVQLTSTATRVTGSADRRMLSIARVSA